MLGASSAEGRFTAIYHQNYWDTRESASGPGSTLQYTENLRRLLPSLLATHDVQRVFDAPCGDFNWMQHVLKETTIDYTGGDIVRPLVEANQSRYGSERVRFVQINIVTDKFPAADLMICRDCLFHLSVADIMSVLRNFVASGIPLLLTTTHSNLGNYTNRDIRTGDFRLIDLFSSPFHFPKETLARIDDWLPPDPERVMCLWRRDQVIAALASADAAHTR